MPFETVSQEHCSAGVADKLPARFEDKESFPTTFVGTLSDDFPNEITDDDLGIDAPRHEWG
ncbi:MAG: hypothetical protein WC208_00720 [Gallionella sp.]|jgi:hypothetical protein